MASGGCFGYVRAAQKNRKDSSHYPCNGFGGPVSNNPHGGSPAPTSVLPHPWRRAPAATESACRRRTPAPRHTVSCASCPTQFRSAPHSRRYSAVGCCPPRHAFQNAFVTCSRAGGGSIEQNARTRSKSPKAAACQIVVVAPRSTSLRSARHCPNTTASDIGVPPVKTAPDASISAPPSRSASSTPTSSLLAAQCSAVSGAPRGPGCITRALTSVPAAIRMATEREPSGK